MIRDRLIDMATTTSPASAADAPTSATKKFPQSVVTGFIAASRDPSARPELAKPSPPARVAHRSRFGKRPEPATGTGEAGTSPEAKFFAMILLSASVLPAARRSHLQAGW